MAPEPSTKNVAEEPTDPHKTPTPPTVDEEEPGAARSTPDPKDKSATAQADEPVSKPEETKLPLEEETAHPDSLATARSSIGAEPATRTSEPELQTEPTAQPEPTVPTEPIVQIEPGVAAQNEVLPTEHVDDPDEPHPALKTPEAKLDETTEYMAASADGKRRSSDDADATL